MGFSRRGFLSSLAAIGMIFRTGKSEELGDLVGLVPGQNTFYKGYQVKWTGWKQAMNHDHDLEVGQWIGYPVFHGKEPWSELDRSRPCLVSSSPGGHYAFNLYDCFDISIHDYQVPINWNTKPWVKDREMKKAWKKLKRMIDAVDEAHRAFPQDKTTGEWNGYLLERRVTDAHV